jgi:dipeptidyl aminopeptidase/acylaminoacyl peptidase
MAEARARRKYWSRLALAAVVALVIVAGVAVVLVARSRAAELISNPRDQRQPLEGSPADLGLPYEDVEVMSVDGFRLVGWYVPTQNGAVVMAQHGYKSDRDELLEEAEMLYRHGFGVLFTTVRAHDASDGELITFGAHEVKDLEAWYQFLLSRPEIDAQRIGIIGNSMGGFLAIQYTALNPSIRAVVAHSPFSSMDDTVATSVEAFTGLPAFPFAPLIVFWAEQMAGIDSAEIDAKQWIGTISPRPVFILMGGQDESVSVESGQLLYDAAGEPKEFWFEPDLGHVAFDTELPEKFEARVVGFFETYLGGSASRIRLIEPVAGAQAGR